MKRWQCSVCGYVHTGEAPPEKCPVCGVGAEAFFEIGPQGEKLAPMASGSKEDPATAEGSVFARIYGFVTEQIYINHLHPISVHFPNGVLPVAVIFTGLAILFNHAGLQEAAYYNLIFVVLTLPAVLFSGYISWHKRYRGAMTKIFVIKIVCAVISSVAAVGLLVWRYNDPAVMDAS